MHSITEFSADERFLGISDPWEKSNLKMYRFNYNFDKYFYLPVVEGYEFITPVFVQNGVSNFFGNVGVSDALQQHSPVEREEIPYNARALCGQYNNRYRRPV